MQPSLYVSANEDAVVKESGDDEGSEGYFEGMEENCSKALTSS
jgi:hypothetical protein